jgi:hypothetical protein
MPNLRDTVVLGFPYGGVPAVTSIFVVWVAYREVLPLVVVATAVGYGFAVLASWSVVDADIVSGILAALAVMSIFVGYAISQVARKRGKTRGARPTLSVGIRCGAQHGA